MFVKRIDRFYPSVARKEDEIIEHLAAGKYKFEIEHSLFHSTPVFIPEEYRSDLVELKGNPFSKIRKRLTNFFSKETYEIYKAIDTRHFIGCLLWGPPGTGKSCFVETESKRFAEKNGAITLTIRNPSDISDLRDMVDVSRREDDSKMVIVVIEEADTYVNGTYDTQKVERQLINFCDGPDTPDNVLLICTTNHINKIPDSLKQRPSRFAIVERVSTIPEDVAQEVIAKFLPQAYRDRVNVKELMFKITEHEIRIDQIKHIILNILVNKMTIERAINIVTKVHAAKIIVAKVEAEQEDDEDEDDD